MFALGLPLSGRSDLCTSDTLAGNGLSEALKESAAATQRPLGVDDCTGLFIRSDTYMDWVDLDLVVPLLARLMG